MTKHAGCSVFITMEVCAEEKLADPSISYSSLLFSRTKNYISNVKEAVDMQRKACLRQK